MGHSTTSPNGFEFPFRFSGASVCNSLQELSPHHRRLLQFIPTLGKGNILQEEWMNVLDYLLTIGKFSISHFVCCFPTRIHRFRKFSKALITTSTISNTSCQIRWFKKIFLIVLLLLPFPGLISFHLWITISTNRLFLLCH